MNLCKPSIFETVFTNAWEIEDGLVFRPSPQFPTVAMEPQSRENRGTAVVFLLKWGWATGQRFVKQNMRLPTRFSGDIVGKGCLD